MPQTYSFDIVTRCDLQEVDNATNQTRKELANRYDFRGLSFEINFDRERGSITLQAPDKHKLNAIMDVLKTRMAKRNVPIKNLKSSEPQAATGSALRQEIDLQQGLSKETAKDIVKFIKDQKKKKLQGSIQGEQVRVQSPSKDDLQDIKAKLSEQDFGVELQFENFR